MSEEQIQFVSPQFDRTDDIVPQVIPDTKLAWNLIHTLPSDELHKLGCQKWDYYENGEKILWLYPKEWFDSIPDGLPITTINKEHKQFNKAEMSDDTRFGALAFGFLRDTEIRK